MDNGEGMPKESHIGKAGLLGGTGVGWQGSKVDFEVEGTGPFVATAWDEDVCVASFRTRHRVVLLIRLWAWHIRFNRTQRTAKEQS